MQAIVQESATSMNQGGKLLKNKLFWVGILDFAEGFPLGVFYDFFPLHFTQMGIKPSEVGFLSLLGLAWTLKFLWAPAVDYYRHHRRWIFLMDVLMGIILLGFAFILDLGPWAWVVIGLFTAFSATSDVAIDGYTIEMLDKNELGVANGIRIGMYRVAILATGFLLALTDWFSWSATYFAGGVILIVCGWVCLRAPQEQALSTRSKTSVAAEIKLILNYPFALALMLVLGLLVLGLLDLKIGFSKSMPHLWHVLGPMGLAALLLGYFWNQRLDGNRNHLREDLNEGPMFGAFFELMQRPYILPVIVFILIYKLADTSMGFWVKPFWLKSGFSLTEIGLVSINIGLGLSIAGGLAGGWFTDRFGIFKGIWILGLFQAFSNLGYAGVAYVIPEPVEGVEIAMQYKMFMYGASVVESFTGGLGNAAFMAFMMAIVNKKRSASEYALLSSIFAFSRSVAGWAGGFGVESMGYAPYFLLTFFLAFPAYFLLPWVNRMLDYTRDWK